MAESRVGGIAATVTFSDGGAARAAPQLLNGNIYFVNPATWVAGGTLTVSGIASYDRISILHEGGGAGEVGVSGSTLFFGGVEIGTVSGGEGTSFTVTFNGAASADAVTAVTERLAYQLGQGGIVTDHSLNIALVDGAGVAVANAGQWEPIAGADHPAYDIGALVTSSLFRPVLGDLNGDGFADLILTGVTVKTGEWIRTDDPEFDILTENFTSIEYSQFEDGFWYARDADIVDSGTRVYINDQNGGFNDLEDARTGTATEIFGALADVDDDGDLDLFWTSSPQTSTTRVVLVSYNSGDGTFHYNARFAAASDSLLSDGAFDRNSYIAAGDVDGNGAVDLFAGIGYATINLHAGDDRLVWQTPHAYDGSGSVGLTKPIMLDYDGDGDTDAIAIGPHDARYFENVGGQLIEQHGAANPFATLLTYSNAYSFGDLDGDGDLDLVIANSAGNVQILWNNSSYGAQSNSTDGSIDLMFTFPETVAPDAYAIDEDQPLVTTAANGVLLNDTIPGTLTAVLAAGPANGTLTLNADGSFSYAPNANYNGLDSFTYRVDDGTTLSEPVTVTLTVNSVTDTIIAVDDAATTLATGTVTIQGLANDLNPEGRSVAVSAINGVEISGPFTTVTLPSGATLEVRADGQFIYNPGNAFDYLVSTGTGSATGLPSAATDSFTYTIDGSTATVSVTVTGVDGPGDAVPARVGGIASGVTFDDASAVVGAPQLLNGNIYFTDRGDWVPGGSMTVTGVAAYDRLSILHQGDGAGEVGVDGSTIRYGGVVVGAILGGDGTTLTVTFNSAADADAVAAVAGRLAYQLGADSEAADHSLQLSFTDGHGVAAVNASQWEAIEGESYPGNPFVSLITDGLWRPVFGDFNGDGHIDLLLSGKSQPTPWVLVEPENSEFIALTSDWPAPVYAIFDGLLYVSNLEGVPGDKLYLNDGSGNYVASSGVLPQIFADDIRFQTADADGDGDLDLFFTLKGFSGISGVEIMLARNDGQGNFSNVEFYFQFDDTSMRDLPYRMRFAIGDLNNNGTLDALIKPPYGIILLKDGEPTFDLPLVLNPSPFGTASTPGVPHLIDYDADGDLDILFLDPENGDQALLRNEGNYSFVEQTGVDNPFRGLFGVGDELGFGDLDSDGDTDILVTNAQGVSRVMWNNGGYGAGLNSLDGTIDLNFDFPVVSNAAPVLDLQLDAVIEMDEASYRAIAADAIVTDTDSADFSDGQLVVTFVEGASADEGVFIGAQIGITAVGGTVLYNGLLIGTYTGGDDQQPLVVTFSALATADAVQQVVRSLVYYNNSFDTGENRDISFVLTDGDGGTSATSVVTLYIEAVDTPVMPEDDYASTPENASVVIDVLANDIDPDGGPSESITAIDGMTILAGQTVTLASGARVTLNVDGTLTYNPNGKFKWLVSEQSAQVAGAFNAYGDDGFTYTLSGGEEVSVELEIVGVDGPGDQLRGSFGNDILIGLSATANYFDLSQGGMDRATGGSGNDAFLMGASLDALDAIDGGAGVNDEVGLRGDYSGGNALVLGSNTLRYIDTIGLLASPGNSYDITTHNDTVAAGQKLTVFGTNLASGSNFTFDGSAETDGSFRLYGGAGIDDLTGGAGNDGFWFGPGRFDPMVDRVDGGAGTNDQLALEGDYTITLDGTSIQGIEAITLQRGPVGDSNRFNLTLADSLVADNGRLTIWGYPLLTSLRVDGSAEAGGDLRIYGGTVGDTLIGGGGNDWLWGGYGGDRLEGGAGADVFAYDVASQSTGVNYDTLVGFDASVDRIDLPFAVTSISAPVSGSLSLATFNQDLAAAIGAAQLGQGQAVMFTAIGGDMDGQTFLIVNGVSANGYQAGTDYVFHLENPAMPITTPEPFV